MLSRAFQPRAACLFRAARPRHALAQSSKRLVAPPKAGDGPLLERRADRELPDPEATRFRWSRTMPLFLAVIACASVAIFNYQKLSSPVVSGTLYALRTSPRARDFLGDEIYFKHRIPWISGEMNPLQGRINIAFSVRGTKNSGLMRFTSVRPTARAVFETTEWSLETTDGSVIDLLDESTPQSGAQLEKVDLAGDEAAVVRGFRQVNNK